MKSACVGVLSIIELKNARWNIEKPNKKQTNQAQRELAKYQINSIWVETCLGN